MSELYQFLIVCPLCLLAGFIDSIAGGGGLISLPAYYLVNLPARLAAGTNKVSASIGTITSVIKYGRSGKISWTPALTATAGSLAGAYFGAEALKAIDEQLILKIMIVLLPIVCVVLLLRRGDFQRTKPVGSWKYPAYAAIGLVVGFYDGMIGPGTGTFLILLFSGLTGMNPIMASGTAKVVNLASGLSSLVSFLLGGYVIWTLGLAAGLFSFAGNLLGSGLAIRKGAKVIQGTLVVVLALILITLIVRTFSATYE
ncbi:MAG: TSUP family transporter [Oscillospiraceae bacterium]|jgi:uncharacterized membrane protein YfcA|nr:TSUP family transporter [Oscillospiraceae bacterium]